MTGHRVDECMSSVCVRRGERERERERERVEREK